MIQKPVQVCIITTIHRDFDNRIYRRQLTALVEDGLSVCMLAPWDFSKRDREDYQYVATKSPTTRLSRIWHGMRTFRAAKRVEAEIYIFHDPDFILFGALLKLLTGKTVVYDCHEDIPLDILGGKDWIPSPIRRPLSWLFRKIENAVAGYLGHVITVIPHLAERFRQTGAETALVRNFANYDVPAEIIQERAVLHSGSMSPNYGAYVLLDVAREMKRRGREDIPIRIVDRFFMADNLRTEMIEAIEAENLCLEIIPPVLAKDMPKILAKGCIGISPRLNVAGHALGYPTKVFEYFAFGLAVIATDLPAHRDLLQDGNLGVLIKDNDPGDWADAIERFFDDEETRLAQVDLGKSAFETTYNWNIEKKTLIAFVRRCLETGH